MQVRIDKVHKTSLVRWFGKNFLGDAGLDVDCLALPLLLVGGEGLGLVTADLMRLVLANILSDKFVLIPWDSGTLLPRNNCALFPGYILAVDCRHASTVFLWDILANLTWNIHTFLPEHILADFLWDITASI